MTLASRLRTQRDSTVIVNEGKPDALELELAFVPDQTQKVLAEQLADGGYVVGYLVHDDDCSNPLEDSDGTGRIWDGRRNSRNAAKYRERMEAWKENKDVGLDVLLDVYSHGGDAWRIHGGGPGFPDEQWDVSNGAGVWVPDDACVEHIEHEAIMLGLPSNFKVRYKTIEGKLNLIVIEVTVGEALQPVLKDPKKYQPDEHGVITLHNRKKGYKSFKAAAKAICKLLGVTQTREDILQRRRQVAVGCAKSAVEVYNEWLAGNCWGVCVETFNPAGEPINQDACWGYIGDNAKEQLQEEVQATVEHAAKPACAECKRKLGCLHESSCGKRVVGCPEVVLDDCDILPDEEEPAAVAASSEEGPPDLSRFSRSHVNAVSVPTDGLHMIYTHHWWVVTPENEVLLLTRSRTPQCNTNREIANRLRNGICKDFELRFLKVAYIVAVPGDFA